MFLNMLILLLLTLYFHVVNSLFNSSLLPANKTVIYEIYNYDEIIPLNVNSTTVRILDFIEHNDTWLAYPTRVHVATNDVLNVDHPVFITAEQQKGVSSWELPLVVKMDEKALILKNMGRTLCPHDAGPDIKIEMRPTVHISTTNPMNTSISIKLRRVTDFYVKVDQNVTLKITPSSPKYYYFSFNQDATNETDRYIKGIPRFNYTIPKSVILIIDSDDELCTTVSIQNNSCPVFDNERDVLYKGYHLTMTTKGGITLTQSMFPVGFYVVFIVRESDDECTGTYAGSQDANIVRTKNITFRVIATISYKEYVIAALMTLAVLVLVPIFALTVLMPKSCKCKEEVQVFDEEDAANTQAGPSSSSDINQSGLDGSGETNHPGPSGTAEINRPGPSGNSETNEPGASIFHGIPPIETTVSDIWVESDDVSSSERQPLEGSVRNTEIEESLFGAHALTVACLTKVPSEKLARRSSRYLWNTTTVSIIYALPVVQLLFTYQAMVYKTGDQDLCYYNFLCAHPLGKLSDFNHVFSNIGYVVLGAVFMAQVRARQIRWRTRSTMLGIPQHYGLMYAMGLALSMEGLFSASYHLCPNKMNFQFDSSYMYMIAILVMIKLYQNRHSDIVPSAQSTFLLLAFVMAIGVLGIVYPSPYFSAVFTIFHLVICFIFTMKIYYTGKFTIGLDVGQRAWAIIRTHGRSAFVPTYRARAILLALANVANWVFAITFACEHYEDFARELLAILMGNAVLYITFYIAMKMVHREWIRCYTLVFMLGFIVAWGLGASFFLDSRTKWSETPAQSRRHNAACSSLEFYDTHDNWHVLSAIGTYFCFNMLLTVDDELVDTPRHLIPTF